MRTARYAYWKMLGSQAVQDVAQRLEAAYQRCFAQQSGRPRFKKVKRYKSFTLKQTSGWKLLSYNHNAPKPNGKFRRSRGEVEIGGGGVKFVQDRPLGGSGKTVTLKRGGLGGVGGCFKYLVYTPG